MFALNKKFLTSFVLHVHNFKILNYTKNIIKHLNFIVDKNYSTTSSKLIYNKFYFF